MLPANREFHVVAGVVIFPTHPGLRDQLAASRKDSAREGGCPGEKCTKLFSSFFLEILSQFARVFDLAPDVGFRRSWYRRKACAAYFCKVPDLRESELGLVRYGPANRGHRSVFGPFEGSFPIGIPARPGKFLAIREFHVVHGCVFFPTCPGSRINLLRVRKTLRASVATSVGKFWNFQHSLISSACFHARGRRSSRCRISTILVSSESLCYLFSKGTGLAQRRAWVKLGQTLVKASPNSGKCIPDHVSRVFGHSGPPSGQKRLGQPLVKLGQPWSNLVNPSQTWSNLREMCPGPSSWGYLMWRALVGSGRLGSGCLVLRADTRENPGGTAKNLPQFACHSLSDALALNRLTHGSKVKVGFRFLVFSLNSTFPTSAFSFPSSSDLALRKSVRPSEYEVYLAFLALGLPIALSCRCLTEAVVAEIVAGPHALDSCECMNIEDAMRASLRWLLLCLLGRSALASHTLGLAISQVVVLSLISGLSSNFSVRGKIAPVWYNKINGETHGQIKGLSYIFSNPGLISRIAIQNSLFPGFDTITDLGDSARGVHSPG
uniref:Uncharacterized protein n=1 Tax=Fagus sylvatica TaxID=28930 RepID=A0A2N9FTA2_FAGSY